MPAQTIKQIKLHTVALPYVEPLRTSFGVEPDKAAVLVELVLDNGVVGWGECAVEIRPGYGSETIYTAEHILNNFLIPRLLGQTLESPTDVVALLQGVRGHHHTKAGLEAAVWDAWAKAEGVRLTDLFARYAAARTVSRGYASVGVSIGIQPSVEATLDIIRKRMAQGYKRIKLKIMPGWDVELARGVRAVYPDILLMLDANSAYMLADAAHLAQLDAYNLMMIEQPLGHDDILQHGELQARLRTPICLDESVKSATELRMALRMDACRILNLKPARVGGFTESLAIYNICVAEGVPLWIGGMLETGVGRAANLAFAALPGVTLPCDISATDRYFSPDLVEPPFALNTDSTLTVPDGAGIGVEVQADRLEAGKARWHEIMPYVEGWPASTS